MVQGIEDAERPDGLKEHFGLRSMSYDPTSRSRSSAYGGLRLILAGVRHQVSGTRKLFFINI